MKYIVSLCLFLIFFFSLLNVLSIISNCRVTVLFCYLLLPFFSLSLHKSFEVCFVFFSFKFKHFSFGFFFPQRVEKENVFDSVIEVILLERNLYVICLLHTCAGKHEAKARSLLKLCNLKTK